MDILECHYGSCPAGDSGDLLGHISVGQHVRGVLRVENTLSGSISIGGDCSGSVLVQDDLAGACDISGSLNGAVTVNDNLSGMLAVDGACTGDVAVHGDVTGSVTMGGQLTSTGRILVDETCSGLINVRNATAILSTIRISNGLTSTGEIRVSDIPGLSSPSRGTIHVGSTAPSFPLPPVVFDGRIRIDPTGTNEWEGTINVVGCHETFEPLDICICGADRGTIILIQDDCTQPVTVACGGTCP
ncbi:hypothetical protein RAS1_20130 [Phycisphaerae bacterium RAS1]|nr:hypothetical protein RAS1_20130 [Phycisphaerae bacterium RAS1]